MLARRVLVLVVLAAAGPAPAAQAATPDIHAHRGGTVVNGSPRYAEESLAAYRAAARHGFVLEVDARSACARRAAYSPARAAAARSRCA